MDLIYLYGPPAVGKLTVAKELAGRIGYRIFHNHLSIDCVLSVFDFGTEPFWRQVRKIREDMLAEAAQVGRDLICTSVYSRGDDDSQIERRLHAVERNGGRVCLVQLRCPLEVLEERVGAPARRAAGKLATADGLRRTLSADDLAAPIPDRASLQLDTDVLTATEAAERIIQHYLTPTGDGRELPAQAACQVAPSWSNRATPHPRQVCPV